MSPIVLIPVNRANGRINTTYPSSLVLTWFQQDGVSLRLASMKNDRWDVDTCEAVCIYDDTGNVSTENNTINYNDTYVVCELDVCSTNEDGVFVNTIIDGMYDDVLEVSVAPNVSHRTWVIMHRYPVHIPNSYNVDVSYLNLLRELSNAATHVPHTERHNRTDITTISLFAKQIRIDLSHGRFPLLTTKRVPFRHVAEELLWFCRGETDTKVLENKGVNIWKANSSRAFLDQNGLAGNPEGDIGPGYGFQWRKFGAYYNGALPGEKDFYDKEYINVDLDLKGFDQLQYVENLLKEDPMSRRIVLSAWAPHQLEEMALPPCHVMAQWYVTPVNGVNELSCMLTMRSCDTFLGLPWNIASYALLTYILAKKCNMTPFELVVNMGDCHLYTNCINQAKIQLERNPGVSPCITLSDSVCSKSWEEITVDDMKIHGYYPFPGISAKMAV